MLKQFLPGMQTLQKNQPFTKQDLLTEQFLIEKEGTIEMYYAPHNEYVNKHAKIIIVGITPGWKQMKIAFEEFINCDDKNDNLETCLIKTKTAARFAGTMRTNLIQMLNECNIYNALNIQNTSDLFEANNHLLHTTSVIKYPVFSKGKNYTGHQPLIERSPLLQYYANTKFPEELAQISTPALIIPLGKAAENIITKLIDLQQFTHHHYLTGFPHPSGANGHRIKQFEEQKHHLKEKVRLWADTIT